MRDETTDDDRGDGTSPPLADRAARRVAELERELSRARRLNEKLEDVLRAISHDLRQPLTSIQIHTALLRQDVSSDRGMKRTDAILRGCERIAALTDDLVEAARLESGRTHLRCEAVRLEPFLADVLVGMAASYDVSRVRLAVAPDLPAVRADPLRFERVIANLVSNALKYSPPHAPVVIEAAAEGDRIVLLIRDRGAGIPADELPRIFERFYRRPGERAEGSGLGLYIARMIAAAHGGRLTAESAVGEGSTFRLELPAWST